jgi:hypothetical protein
VRNVTELPKLPKLVIAKIEKPPLRADRSSILAVINFGNYQSYFLSIIYRPEKFFLK